MPATKDDLFALLDELGISHQTKNHKPVFTVEESAEIKADMPGAHTKNLFLKDKGGNFFLVCAESHAEIKVNKLPLYHIVSSLSIYLSMNLST